MSIAFESTQGPRPVSICYMEPTPEDRAIMDRNYICVDYHGETRDFELFLSWELEKRDTIERGERRGYDEAVIADVLADVWRRLILARAGVAEYD